MTDRTCDLLIIGGGLTGLALAYLLRNEDMVIGHVEARDRLGGRILTVQEKHTPPLEMGATLARAKTYSTGWSPERT